MILDSSERVLVFDSEANGLLEKVTKMWCIVCEDYYTGEIFLFHDYPEFDGYEGADENGNGYVIPVKNGSLEEGAKFLNKAKGLIAHNLLGYDLFLIKKFFPKFKIRYDYPMIRDTLLESQVLWFDRKPVKGYKGIHGLAVWGARLGIEKPEIEDWSFMDADKLHRCIEDVKINTAVARQLESEKEWLQSNCNGITFDKALEIEHEYRYWSTKQELYGALVDKQHMIRCCKELDEFIETLRKEIEPRLPPSINVKSTKESAHNVAKLLGAARIPPEKVIWKMRKGESYSTVEKELYKPTTKIHRVIRQKKYSVVNSEGKEVRGFIFDKAKDARAWAKENLGDTKGFKYPWKEEETLEYDRHTINHFSSSLDSCEIVGAYTKVEFISSKMSQHEKVKLLLVSLGWKTDEWTFEKESDGQFKRASSYGEVRWPKVPIQGMQLVEKYKAGERIPSTPKITEDSFQWIPDGLGKKIKEYNTYSHRRKFIQNPSDETKGLLNNIREDGRISCGIMTFGTTAGRASQYGWVNAPSVQALYGENIRKIIVAPEGKKLIGIDMPSAHPRLLADFTQNETFIKAVDGKEEEEDGTYVGEDFHTVNSVLFRLNTEEDISICRETQDHGEIRSRVDSGRKKGKGGSYCVPVDSTKVLTEDGWRGYEDLFIGQKVLSRNKEGVMEFTPIRAIHFFDNQEVVSIKGKHSLNLEATKDHRWLVNKRKFKNNERTVEEEFRLTKDLNSECSIIRNGKYLSNGRLDITPDEASLLGWILADGCVSWKPYSTKTSSKGGLKRGVKCVITQAESKYTEKIENLLNLLECHTGYMTSEGVNSPIRTYNIKSSWFRDFWERCGFAQQGKKGIDLEKWVLQASDLQIKNFLYAFYLADGSLSEDGKRIIGQKKGNICEGVKLACYLSGYLPSTRRCGDSSMESIRLRERKATTLQNAEYKEVARSTDVFCITTDNSTFVIKQGECITVTGNCTLYGGSDKKLALTLGIEEELGAELKHNFLSGLGLDLLLEEVGSTWSIQKRGKGSYISVLGGYHVWSNSKHKIINFKALGSEAVVQKVAIINICREIQRLGLNTRLILNVHDECLFEVPEEELEQVKPIIANIYVEAAEELGLTLDWSSTAKVGESYCDCH